MRTTLDLPQDLITQAMKVSGAKTKSQVIKIALQEMINKNQRMKLLTFKGKVDLDIDLDISRGRS
jgi:Arc/MetJ family transcription regulator